MRIKLKIPRKSKQNPKADITAFRKPAIRDEFALKVKNKYDWVMEENCKQIPEEQGRKRQNEWELLKIAITHTQEEVLPKRKKKAKQHWMTQEILDLMETRKSKKGTSEYQAIDNTIKDKCRKAKEEWAKGKCQKIENLSRNHQTKEMFQEIKCLNPRKSNQSGCIKDKEGKIIFEAEKIIERWKEYIEDLFADQKPENPIKNFPKGPDITSQEVETTLQQMKKGKAMGIDNIPTESLQALGDFGIKQLTKICNQNV